MSAAGKNACPTKTGRATRPACGTVGGKPEADHRHKAAGVARKTACSTERPVWQAWRRAPRGGAAVGWKGGRRVEGAKADRNVGRRQECLPHREPAPQEVRAVQQGRGKVGSRPPAQGCRCGTQDCVLHGEAGVASLAARSAGRSRGWAERRAEGEGAKADRNVGRRQECQPRKRCVRYSRGGGKPEADHRHKAAGVARKTACSTERPVWHARLRAPRRGRCGKPGGALHGEAGAASVRASSTAGAGRRTALLGDGVSAGYRRWRRKERWF
jgi:hypothetical protein